MASHLHLGGGCTHVHSIGFQQVQRHPCHFLRLHSVRAAHGFSHTRSHAMPQIVGCYPNELKQRVGWVIHPLPRSYRLPHRNLGSLPSSSVFHPTSLSHPTSRSHSPPFFAALLTAASSLSAPCLSSCTQWVAHMLSATFATRC